jgi:hypothetical protein
MGLCDDVTLTLKGEHHLRGCFLVTFPIGGEVPESRGQGVGLMPEAGPV